MFREHDDELPDLRVIASVFAGAAFVFLSIFVVIPLIVAVKLYQMDFKAWKTMEETKQLEGT